MLNRLTLINGIIISFILLLFSFFLLPLYSFPCGPDVCMELFTNKISLAELWLGQLQENVGLLQGYDYHTHLLIFSQQTAFSIIPYDIIVCLILGISFTAILTNIIKSAIKAK